VENGSADSLQRPALRQESALTTAAAGRLAAAALSKSQAFEGSFRAAAGMSKRDA
jgi:hypothetical protein